MPSNRSSSEKDTSKAPRYRRAHTKSRRGCRNCKLRRVKCDEGKPQCQTCQKFGVTCNYNSPKTSDLQFAWQDTPSELNPEDSLGQLVFSAKPVPTIKHPAVTVGNVYGSFELDSDSLALLHRFQHRTAFTFATARVRDIYQNDVVKIALEQPFLMHIILTITATHDRYLSIAPEKARRSMVEAYHWSKGAELLNRKLSSPILPQDRDALWATAAMLGIASVTSIEASNPWEAWPLKPYDPNDLDWLDMSQGKEAIWKVTDPLRPDSIFHKMAPEYRALNVPTRPCEFEEIPEELARLCNLSGVAELQHNPYYLPVSMLVSLRGVQCTQASMTRFLQFMGQMQPAFRNLLHKKDPRALMILANWYAPMRQSLWWIARRAQLECQAICLYLEKHHPNNRDLQKMLPRLDTQGLTMI